MTGLPSYVNKQALYFETGWETLESRRDRRKLILFYKIHNDLTPSYLHELLPIQNRNLQRYPLRNNNDYVTPNHRLTNTRLSFIPNATRLWNNLPELTRNQSSVSRFRNAISPRQHKPPTFLSYGPRRTNIIQTKLRYDCSSLKYDLYRVNLTDSPTCQCGHSCENAFHYLLECPMYNISRNIMLNNLQPYYPVNLDILLSGNPELSNADNEEIFRIVQTFIRTSNRF